MPLPRSLDAIAAKAALDADATLVYLDVRSTMEFAQGHPPRALNVPLAEFDPTRGMTPNSRFLEAVRALCPKEAAVIVGCASGGRSRQAQSLLLQDGYCDVADLVGGFQGGMGPLGPAAGWTGCGLPVVKDGTTYAAALARAGL